MKYLVIVFLFLTGFVHAAVNIELVFEKNKIKQGSIENASMMIDGTSFQQIEVQKLKGQTIADTVYFLSVGPLLRKDSGNSFSSDVKVIIAKVPEDKKVSGKLGAVDINVNLSNIEMIPTESPKTYLFGTFEAPENFNFVPWLVGVLIIGSLFWGGLKLNKRFKLKAELKAKRSNLKKEILAAKTYDEVIEVWKKKLKFCEEFPHIEESFKKLEMTLFKYMFKSQQTEREQNEVLDAYKEFKTQIEGGFNGI